MAPLFLGCICSLLLLLGSGSPADAQETIKDIEYFSSLKDRSTGTQGAEDAADYILKVFSNAGLSEVGAQEFLLPTPEVVSASLEVDGESLDLYPWGPNMVYLPMTPMKAFGALCSMRKTEILSTLRGKTSKGSIVLMEMSSWIAGPMQPRWGFRPHLSWRPELHQRRIFSRKTSLHP